MTKLIEMKDLIKVEMVEEPDFSIIIYDECLECKMPKNPYHQKNSTCGKIEKETYDQFIKRMEIY